MSNQPLLFQLLAGAHQIVEAWQAVGKCEDEFGAPASACAERYEHLDNTIVALRRVLRETFPCPRCQGQQFDQGACEVCGHSGYMLPAGIGAEFEIKIDWAHQPDTKGG